MNTKQRITLGSLILVGAGIWFSIQRFSGGDSVATFVAPIANQSSPLKSHRINEDEQSLPSVVYQKKNDVINRAISEGWGNHEIGALIEGFESLGADDLLDELWKRNPKSGSDYAILAAYSKDPKLKLIAATEWSKLEPSNIAPALQVAFLETQGKPLKELVNRAQAALALGKFDLHESARLIAFDTAMIRANMSEENGIHAIKTELVANSAALTLRRILNESPQMAVLTKIKFPDPDATGDDAVSVASSVVHYLSARPARSLFEVREISLEENSILSQLPKDMEYGREGYTVEQRMKDSNTERLAFQEMYDTCVKKLKADDALLKVYNAKVRTLGEYAAVKGLYETLVKSY